MKHCLFAWLLWASSAMAHQASTGFLQLQVDGSAISGRWDIALRDLELALGLDADNDQVLTWGEVRQQQARIASYALGRLVMRADEQNCTLRVTGLQIVDHADVNHASLALSGQCPHEPVALSLQYDLLFDLDAQHRGLLSLDLRGNHAGLFSADERLLRFNAAGASWSSVFSQYLRAGARHVWAGADHMLFLAGLFLPALLRRSGRAWLPAANLRDALIRTGVLVTGFTLAHALTLTLAATGYFAPPTRWVESAVAATVLFAGLNNLVPMVFRGLFWLATAFGLIHGAAIAGALLDLGLPPGNRTVSLLAFNLGVELAQLAVLLVVMPPCYFLRRSVVFRWAVFIPGALVITVIGALWFAQRALGMDSGLPFFR